MTVVAYMNEIIYAVKNNYEHMKKLEEYDNSKFLTNRVEAAYNLLNNHQNELFYFIERLHKKETANQHSTSPKE